MATYRRFRVQRKYINGQPTDETRLGEQIDSTDYPSLEECERGSGCTDLEYRWVDVQNEYICEGMNKYTKQMKQQKCVTETEWADVYPYEYQKGTVIETSSTDCGYVPTSIKLYVQTDGNGELDLYPIKSQYNYNEVITLDAVPHDDYEFSCYYYGSTNTYGLTTTNSHLMLEMTHDWYVSAAFSYNPTLYNLYTTVEGDGRIIVNPSKSGYLYGELVDLTASASSGYVFQGFEYGSTAAYGSTTLNKNFQVTMYNDLYAKAKFIKSVTPPTSGSLYYSYINGTESWYSWTKSILSSADNNGSNAKIIIDYDAVITSIPENAFFGCSRLEMVSFPNCTYVSNSAFLLGTLDSQTKKLQSFYMPNVQTIGKTAFYGCGFSSLYLPQLLSGDSYCFAYCASLVSVNLPLVTYLSEGAFCEDTNLTSVNLPNLSVVYPYTFQLCQSLYSIRLSNVQTLLSSAFDRCTHLQSATFDVCSLIYEYAFYSCTDLSRITLLSNQVCSLRYSEAFWRTGITSSKGSILVPANLVAAYKSARNWSYFSNRIFGA